MNISLTPELEQLVSDKVKTGMYQTASEVIREGSVSSMNAITASKPCAETSGPDLNPLTAVSLRHTAKSRSSSLANA